MQKLIVSLIAATLGLAVQTGFAADAKPAAATSGCEEKALDKNGKPLAGAAKTAFLKKCEGDAKPAAPAASSGCAEKAVGKNGKPLAGAAKAAFMKKCEKDAAGA